MRLTSDYLALQPAYDRQRLDSLARPEFLTTARFESVFRELSGYGMLDLVFENAGDIAVVHAVGVETLVLATLEGPALLWPATLPLAAASAEAIEEFVTPWLLTLVRGRAVAGEYVRNYQRSEAFLAARRRKFYGAATLGNTLPLIAPFVYARRFARDRDVFVRSIHGALAAMIVGTVARSVMVAEPHDRFAERWYGRLPVSAMGKSSDVAIIDDSGAAHPSEARYIITLAADASARTIVIPTPVPNDQLFTFDPADAPPVATFSVRAPDLVDRAVRVAATAHVTGGSGGRVALVVREDALAAPDADTDAVAELAERLRGEGLEPTIVGPIDPRIVESDIVHVFGGVRDKHIGLATASARKARLPFVLSLEPVAPYTKYYEDGLIAALRAATDESDKSRFLNLFYQQRLQFDGIPREARAEQAEREDRALQEACTGALAIFLAPGDDPAVFAERYPLLASLARANAPVLIAPEPQEASIAEITPAQPFLFLHGPLTSRSAFAYILSALGETALGVVVAGPVVDVEMAATLRRIAGSNVVFVADPSPADVAALYRRARAVVFPALRPTGAGRLIRAALCGALPLVHSMSPLARLVPAAAQFDAWSPAATVDAVQRAMNDDCAAVAGEVARTLAASADQQRAFAAVIEVYARAAVPASA